MVRLSASPKPLFKVIASAATSKPAGRKSPAKGGADYYLKGTDQSIEELLSPAWEMASCARCDMIVPTPEVMFNPFPCPCNDLSSWPNEEIPQPRLPVNSQDRLSQIRNRILSKPAKD